MNRTNHKRSAWWLVVNALALAGVVGFSVAAALEPEVAGYVVGQIVAASVLLVSLIAERYSRRKNHPH